MNTYLQFISYYFPDKKITNVDIANKFPEWSVEKISEKIGIEERSICDDNQIASDLALNAANNLFQEYLYDRNNIDYLLLCTQSPDYFLPTTACILQDKLGLRKDIGALDFNLGCSGYIYGLGLAKGLIATGQARNVLLITSETYSKYIHPKDKGNISIFGDAAAATVVSATTNNNGLNAVIGNFEYGTDGSGYEKLIVKNGGSRHRHNKGDDVFDENGNVQNDSFLFMNGKEIFNFTAFRVPPLVQKTLEKNHISLNKLDLAVFHQANEYMLNFVRSRCKIDKEKFYLNFRDCGNTVSSTIPIALKRAIEDGTLKGKSNILLAGFGVGLSMGAVTLSIENN